MNGVVGMKGKKVAKILKTSFCGCIVLSEVLAFALKKNQDKKICKAEAMSEIPKRRMGLYEKYIKRIMNVVCAGCAVVVLSPVYAVVALLVKKKLGSPVIFAQYRPGLIAEDGKETIFRMYKFRTMTDERDRNGNLFPDEARLTKFGAWLRATSLDELPELFNILNGDSGIIGTTKKNLDFTRVSLA